METRARTRLKRQDWVDAALEAIADGGLAAVAVVPLAERLGATKGSFYWHFPSREALIEAALAAWEQTTTSAVIAEIENTCVKSHGDERDDHGAGASKPTP